MKNRKERNKQVTLKTWLGMLLVFEALFFQMLCEVLNWKFQMLSIALAYFAGFILGGD